MVLIPLDVWDQDFVARFGIQNDSIQGRDGTREGAVDRQLARRSIDVEHGHAFRSNGNFHRQAESLEWFDVNDLDLGIGVRYRSGDVQTIEPVGVTCRLEHRAGRIGCRCRAGRLKRAGEIVHTVNRDRVIAQKQIDRQRQCLDSTRRRDGQGGINIARLIQPNQLGQNGLEIRYRADILTMPEVLYWAHPSQFQSRGVVVVECRISQRANVPFSFSKIGLASVMLLENEDRTISISAVTPRLAIE